ncbi:MAG TPA: hypothetical protein PKM88_00145, partial [bacterium]|nr:hypothetical protein [bacterium]
NVRQWIEIVMTADEKMEWPIWKCTALTVMLCGAPVFASPLGFSIISVLIWMLLIIIYAGILKVFGSSFVIEGAIIVLVIATLVFAGAKYFTNNLQEQPAQQEMTSNA